VPMTDDPVTTRISVVEGGIETELHFQEYWVARRARDEVKSFRTKPHKTARFGDFQVFVLRPDRVSKMRRVFTHGNTPVDGVYWVPATTEPDPDPERQLSHVYDNRARIETRVKLLQTGVRYSQEPASRMRRLVSNIEVEAADGGELVAGSNFLLAELAVQAGRELHWWAGRATHRLRRVDGQLRMSRKTVVLVNAAEPLPNLAFLI